LSEIRFGVVIPQGWSYDLPRIAESAHLQHNMKNLRPSVQYEFSKNISKAVDNSSGFVYAAYGCVFIFSFIYLGVL
jgi:hypothetical protein